MNISKGTIFMAMSGLVGLVAMYSVHHYIFTQTQAAVKPEGQVMIAAADISPGAVITKEMVKSAIWPRELIPPKAAEQSGPAGGPHHQRPGERRRAHLAYQAGAQGNGRRIGGSANRRQAGSLGAGR